MPIYPVAVLLCMLILAGPAARAAAQAGAGAIDTARAHRVFAEAHALAARDGGRLWGLPLAGPMLLVDPATRAVAADRADPEGRLHRHGALWAGTLPPDVPVANTALDWAGRRWTMLLWPLTADSMERRMLLAHELWHRVQDSLGFSAATTTNAHLDEAEGRLWLRLEARALRAALRAEGAARAAHAADALAFRRARAQRFPGADSSEAVLELNEGLASYTGLRLAGWPAAAQRERAVRLLDTLDAAPSLARSFAYATGPAYGLLLDALEGGAWRREVRSPGDLARRLARALGEARGGVAPSPSLDESALRRRAERYGHAEVAAAERERAERRAVRLAELRARFVDRPVLRLPMVEMQISFDPTKQESLDTLGVVFPTLGVSGAWGVLTVDSGGALVRWGAGQVVVPAPADAAARPLRGDGWRLELKDGWEVAPGERAGDLVVRRRAGGVGRG